MIKKVVIRNFKAIKDTKSLELGPLNVFIGNNGTGKSSVMEALHCLQLCVGKDLNEGFKEWGGLLKIHNYRTQEEATQKKNRLPWAPNIQNEGIYFEFECLINNKRFEYKTAINTDANGLYIIEKESLSKDGKIIYTGNYVDPINEMVTSIRNSAFSYEPTILFLNFGPSSLITSADADSIKEFKEYILSWEFLYLNAHNMGKPVLLNPLEKDKTLDYDGRNIAEYLLWLKNQDGNYFDNLTESLKFILPYLKNVEPHTLELQGQQVEILMNEDHPKGRALEGWLLSSGTLRIAAILATFHNPKPAPVLFIDEIENGLDPRTIAFLLEEIRNETQSGEMQVIFTTHSPYLLDLLPLESIIVTERDENGAFFHKAANEEEMKRWKDKFSPGELYTSGSLTK